MGKVTYLAVQLYICGVVGIYCTQLTLNLKIKCNLTFNITNNSLRMLPSYFSLKPYISRLQPSGKCLDLFVVVVVYLHLVLVPKTFLQRNNTFQDLLVFERLCSLQTH